MQIVAFNNVLREVVPESGSERVEEFLATCQMNQNKVNEQTKLIKTNKHAFTLRKSRLYLKLKRGSPVFQTSKYIDKLKTKISSNFHIHVLILSCF